MKYSEKFNRDFNWYLKHRHIFDFDGRMNRDVVYDREGVDGKKAFYLFDGQGKIVPTKHPNLFLSLLKTKGSINLHLKMWKEGISEGSFTISEFREALLPWMIKILEHEK